MAQVEGMTSRKLCNIRLRHLNSPPQLRRSFTGQWYKFKLEGCMTADLWLLFLQVDCFSFHPHLSQKWTSLFPGPVNKSHLPSMLFVYVQYSASRASVLFKGDSVTTLQAEGPTFCLSWLLKPKLPGFPKWDASASFPARNTHIGSYFGFWFPNLLLL